MRAVPRNLYANIPFIAAIASVSRESISPTDTTTPMVNYFLSSFVSAVNRSVIEHEKAVNSSSEFESLRAEIRR
jgi:hypothetical protein